MRKLILNWLFGTDDVDAYIDVLRTAKKYCEQVQQAAKDHIKTLEECQESIRKNIKLLEICVNHGIDVVKEMDEIEL